ncbi:MAG: uracil-DNA glycosylase [Anaerolineaceae bacterium]|nr:uracil-DNA glycosylase [Anaerolineaceae bacterium]
MKPAQVMEEIIQQVAHCKKCALHFSRKNAVPGSGPIKAEVMFIGEGPGFHENEKGLPFVGAAGKFLDQLLEEAGLDRNSVFITNVVKCRPPGNRDPQPEELAACSEYLDRQIAVINPLVIVTLGRFSMARYQPNAKISNIHGKAAWNKDRLIVNMYHPAAALHQPKLKNTLLQDFAKLPGFVSQARNQRPISASLEESTPLETDKEDPQQLSLFL